MGWPPRVPLAYALLGVAVALVLAGSAGADPAAPAPTITPIAPGAYVNGSGGADSTGVNLSAVAQYSDLDANNTTWVVSFSLNATAGGEIVEAPLIVLLSSGPGDAMATLRARVTAGLYTLTWCAAAAPQQVCTSTDFIVDAAPPQGTATAPSLTNSSRVTLRVDVADDGSGISDAPVTVLYRTSCSVSWVPAALAETRLPGRVVGEVALDFCAGFNVFQVTVADRAGNAWSSGVRFVAVDLAPPAIVNMTPEAFSTVLGGPVLVRATIRDNVSGLDTSSVEAQFSSDGGVTWGAWFHVEVMNGPPTVWFASFQANGTDGSLAAVRWRAADRAGNVLEPTKSAFFRINGPPFLVRAEPREGAVFYEYVAIAFRAEWADPDGDAVFTTWRSDVTGLLGSAAPIPSTQVGPPPTVRRSLPIGVHNITVVGDDHSGHLTMYTYQIEVVKRPPPDARWLLGIALVAMAMVGSAWWAWKREVEKLEASKRE